MKKACVNIDMKDGFLHSLTNQDIVLPSFVAHYGYKSKLSASDMVLACAAVLEGVVSWNDNKNIKVCMCVCTCKENCMNV